MKIDFFGEYLLNLNFGNVSEFRDIIESFYPLEKQDSLRNNLELSLLVDNNNFNLRFGLFGLHDTEAIIRLFRRYNHDYSTAKSVNNIMEGFTPEYAIGIDWKMNEKRLKTYFLRLPDNPRFEKEIAAKIYKLAYLLGIKSSHLSNIDKTQCCLIGVDYYNSAKRNLKVYTREKTVNFAKISKRISHNGIETKCLDSIYSLFDENDFIESNQSYKYSNDCNNLSGYAVFFETSHNVGEKVNLLINACHPEKFGDFKRIIGALESNGLFVNYTNLGLTFSLKERSESICLYYKIAGQKVIN